MWPEDGFVCSMVSMSGYVGRGRSKFGDETLFMVSGRCKLVKKVER